ncbi:hypothetical protein NWP17_04715 [Chrysosporum bergii ANA360D]|uniref:Uncharacterized protein n=1 Tax=Chrysosporum bergii ANA360D TaxID=617107 RepID=A0AA43KBB1_9CYAN|nr:hypothetical protein [Chrysosporum bergii]MDH6059745.1 hypothetical protein [Chrysosporum bergii ANA360D]
MSQESIKAIVSAYFANIAAMSPEGWVGNFAEDAVGVVEVVVCRFG